MILKHFVLSVASDLLEQFENRDVLLETLKKKGQTFY